MARGLPASRRLPAEGITIGSEPYAYIGSIAHGAVLRASLATGRGRVPTTAAVWQDRIYLPNARFDVAQPTPETDYDVVSVERVRAAGA
nr:hypothetical protein OH820_05625 [Streptomyces sp. NBC_00857]